MSETNFHKLCPIFSFLCSLHSHQLLARSLLEGTKTPFRSARTSRNTFGSSSVRLPQQIFIICILNLHSCFHENLFMLRPNFPNHPLTTHIWQTKFSIMLDNIGYFRFNQILTNPGVDIRFILPTNLLLHKSLSRGGNRFEFSTKGTKG